MRLVYTESATEATGRTSPVRRPRQAATTKVLASHY